MKHFLLLLLCITVCLHRAGAQDKKEDSDVASIQETIKKYKTANEKENIALQKANEVVKALADTVAKRATLDSAKAVLASANNALSINATDANKQAVVDATKLVANAEQTLDAARTMLTGKVSEAKAAIADAEKSRKETNTDETLSPIKKIMEDNILLLTAADFDFTGKFDVSYVGHLNIFAPRLFTAKKGGDARFGINAGIMKLNYRKDDTVKGYSRTEDYTFDPLSPTLDTIGKQYLRQYNSYKHAVNNVTWSVYAQPTLRLTRNSKQGSAIYAHLHTELVVSTWTVTSIRNTIAEDTMTATTTSARPLRVLEEYPATSVEKITRVNGYFGAGLTGELEISDNGMFFVQPTIGWSSADNFIKANNTDLPPSRVYRTNKAVAFYLIRAYYIHTLGEATVTIGTDIRGYIENNSTPTPNYATYIGLNLKLKSIVDLFKS